MLSTTFLILFLFRSFKFRTISKSCIMFNLHLKGVPLYLCQFSSKCRIEWIYFYLKGNYTQIVLPSHILKTVKLFYNHICVIQN